MENEINIRTGQMLRILTMLSNAQIQKYDEPILFSLSPNAEIGYGSFNRYTDKPCGIEVGISPYSKSLIKRNTSVRSLDFSRACITTLHEFGHCDQHKAQDNIEILMSDLSKQGNIEYYRYNWNIMPHEIDAEYSGVISA